MNHHQPIALDGLPVLYRERPFDGRLVRRVVAPGATLAEIVATTEGLPRSFDRLGIVCINGEEVPREAWHRVRPRYRAGREILVTLHYPMQGGGSGGGGVKNILRIVATIAIIVAAAAVSGGALGGVLGAGFAAGTVGAALAGAAVSIGGALAIAALTPPPSLNNAQTSEAALSGTQPGAASLSGNALAPGAAVPRVIGTMRVYPPLGCEPLIEVVGDDEFVEGVFVLAGPHKLTDLQSGGLDIATLQDVFSEASEGLPASPKVSLVQRYSKTDQPGIEMSNFTVDKTNQAILENQGSPNSSCPIWHRIISRNSPDEIWVTLTWPEGLIVEDAPNNPRCAPLRFRMRLRGTSSWINLPEVHFVHKKSTSYKKMVKFMWRDAPSLVPTPPTDEAPYIAWRTVPAQAAAPAQPGWAADGYFSTGAGDDMLKASNVATTGVKNVGLFDDRVEFYLGGATFPQGQYEIELMYGFNYLISTFNQNTYALSGTVYSLFRYHLDGSSQFAPPSSLQGLHNRCDIDRVSSVINKHPIQSQDFAHIAVRAKNRTIGQFSALASGYVYDWDGAAWTALSTTSNPAAHFRDVLANNRLNARPLPESLIDNADLLQWRALDFTCDAVCEGRNVMDVLTMIAASGYARPRQSETWGVIVDQDRSADGPVQTFSPRNMRGFGWTKAFAQRPDGFRARFSDVTNDYKERELIVRDPDSAIDDGRYEDIRYDGLVEEADVVMRAELDLRQLRYRMNFYKGETNRQHLVCRRGDLVGVSYDVIQTNAGSAYIKAVVTDGMGNVIGLQLDGTIPLGGSDAFSAIASAFASYALGFADERTGVAIRLRNQTSMVAEVTGASPETGIVNFATPFVDPGPDVLATGALVVCGPLGSEYKRMIVFDVTPKSELTAALTFVDEAPQLFAA